MDWQEHTTMLADQVTPSGSAWRDAVLHVPRQALVPAWFERDGHGWRVRRGVDDPQAWAEAAYADRSLVTRVGRLHADHATPGQTVHGRPTSSATMPGLTVRMYEHALIAPGMRVLDVGTGSGYGTGLLAHRFGADQVVSVDVDEYLVDAAAARLAAVGLRPAIYRCNALGEELPRGGYDRIVATVGVPRIPPAWITALRTGGRVVATLADTSVIVVATKQEDGTLRGRTTWDRAGFMPAHSGGGHPDDGVDWAAAATASGICETGRYPVLDVEQAWDVQSMMALLAPGIRHRYSVDGNRRVMVMAHPDGSWARAEAWGDQSPAVRQGGPRRLWDLLDHVRDSWVRCGELPVRGASVLVAPDGRMVLRRGSWKVLVGHE